MLVNNTHLIELTSPMQQINARVDIYKDSTLVTSCTCGDYLSDFYIERVGEGKFFGYGICHKLNMNLIDVSRELNLSKENTIKIYFGVKGDFYDPFTTFYVDDVKRDETSNSLTIVAYDVLHNTSIHKVEELTLSVPYTLRSFASSCASFLGTQVAIINVDDDCFDTSFEQGANFDGTETIRSALNAIAEATQTVYYIDREGKLVFKRLDATSNALAINKEQYISLINEGAQVLSNITSTTELGDSISSTSTIEGVTQYVRDNPFWELREDTATLVDNAQLAIGGISINQFECNWIGNYLLEIGDKIKLTAEDNSDIISYLLDDKLSYDGTLSQLTKWKYNNNNTETADNPTSLGDALNKTFAKVDKVNKQIELVVSETNGYSAAISELQLNTEGINASVTRVEENTANSLDAVNGELATLIERVDATVTAEDVTLQINTTLEDGVSKVETSTGFTFNDEGLHIGKSNSGIENKLDNTGMYVKSDGEEVLSANNSGVEAKNLHANTYLIIGNNSRFEDYEEGSRTGCFWIGGN